jgi:hypothetical protein
MRGVPQDDFRNASFASRRASSPQRADRVELPIEVAHDATGATRQQESAGVQLVALD